MNQTEKTISKGGDNYACPHLAIIELDQNCNVCQATSDVDNPGGSGVPGIWG